MAEPTRKYDLLTIGGSAGSLTMVLKIIPQLTLDMNLAVVIIFHRKQSEDNVLLDVLATKTTFVVKEAEDKDEIRPGVIYIAPAEYHLLIEKDKTISLDDSEKVNYSRPSIDVTFESAAEACGESLACLLLSGANADGVEGLIKAKQAGALIMVQDPASAEVSYMPEQAMARVKCDFIVDGKNVAKLKSVLR